MAQKVLITGGLGFIGRALARTLVRQGMTVPQIVAAFRASNPALASDADTYVTISVHAYCPQNGNLVGGGS